MEKVSKEAFDFESLKEVNEGYNSQGECMAYEGVYLP